MCGSAIQSASQVTQCDQWDLKKTTLYWLYQLLCSEKLLFIGSQKHEQN